MKRIVAKNDADVSRKAVNIIAAQIHLKPDCVLGLAELRHDFALVAGEAALKLVKDLI